MVQTKEITQQTIKFNHGKRPCTVNGEKGYFHLWEQYSRPVDTSPLIGGAPAGIISCVFGIVEFPDGVRRVEPTNIAFTDKEE